jgi:hypothetical protein
MLNVADANRGTGTQNNVSDSQRNGLQSERTLTINRAVVKASPDALALRSCPQREQKIVEPMGQKYVSETTKQWFENMYFVASVCAQPKKTFFTGVRATDSGAQHRRVGCRVIISTE